MKFKRSDTIFRELWHHAPFTLSASILAGILVIILFASGLADNSTLRELFEIAHPLHVLVSAAATAAIYNKYKKSVFNGILIGVVGAILIGTISDILLPWIAGNLFSLHTHLHLPIVEKPLVIIGVAIIGSLFGIYAGMFRVNHSIHIFLSVFASFFYLLAFSIELSLFAILANSLIVFLAVYIPCCVSDIVFPILFIKKPCKKCGYWHD